MKPKRCTTRTTCSEKLRAHFVSVTQILQVLWFWHERDILVVISELRKFKGNTRLNMSYCYITLMFHELFLSCGTNVTLHTGGLNWPLLLKFISSWVNGWNYIPLECEDISFVESYQNFKETSCLNLEGSYWNIQFPVKTWKHNIQLDPRRFK